LASNFYSEDDLLPLSGLQHMVFCERQWALIHLEQQWGENRLTAEGRLLHQRADSDTCELREGVRIWRGVRVRSLRLGLAGRADVVEFRRQPDGSMRPLPVEYKHGRAKADASDVVQLCAQAICLEEMMEQPVPEGALFYGKNRRRTPVLFDIELRTTTESLARHMHELYDSGQTPPAIHEPKCDRCSLLEICLPGTAARGKSASQFVRRNLRLSREEPSEGTTE
jgi:CRISPR-associated exonuclease Cas4